MRISPNRVLIYPQAAIQREATKGAQHCTAMTAHEARSPA
jgi:hypothetical protein